MLRVFLSVLFALCSATISSPAQDAQKPLTSCVAIRALPRETAARALPVQVRGVVTFSYGVQSGGFVVQDGTAGIYVERLPGARVPESRRRGALVEITGHTNPGRYAPLIVAETLRVLGEGPLPPATPLTFGDLLSGKWDCQRVEVTGVVQGAEEFPKHEEKLRFTIASAGGRIAVHVLEPLALPTSRLIDAEIRVRGVAVTFFNNRGELVGARVELTSRDDVEIVALGPEDPFAVPEVSISSLRPFSPEGVTFHRRRIRGVVTLVRPGEALYVQQGDRGVRVETRATADLAPGDRVEASGFVEVAQHFGEMRGAVARKIGADSLPEPLEITRERVLGGTIDAGYDLDGRRVALRGRIEQIDPGPDTAIAFVESEGQLVSLDLGPGLSARELDRLAPASEVRAIGILRVQLASGWPALSYPQPTGFSLVAHSPADIAVLRAAPWWTPQRLALALGCAIAVLAATLAWNWLLRRRVEQRGAQLAEEIRARREAAVEFDATLRERERLAADLHDTLEQTLTGLALQLETADALCGQSPDQSQRHLALARQLLERSRTETRRSVWNLRAQALEDRSLPDALRDLAGFLSEGRPLHVTMETEGEPRGLPDFIAGNLFLLAQEALTNALKHSGAQHLTLRMGFAPDAVELGVHDNGRGFDPASVDGVKQGHFGLQGMRERIKRLGGTIRIESAPGAGTQVLARVPVS